MQAAERAAREAALQASAEAEAARWRPFERRWPTPMPLATRVAHTLDRLGDAVAAAHLADWNGTRADRDHSNVAVLDSVASRGAPTDLLALEKCLREGKGGGQRASESAWLTESELAQAMRIAWRERSADAGRMVALELLLRQQETRLHPQLGACLVRFSIAAAPVPDQPTLAGPCSQPYPRSMGSLRSSCRGLGLYLLSGH